MPLGLRFVLLALVCVSTMILDHREGHLSKLRQGLSMVVYPVQLLVDAPFELRRFISDSIADRAGLIAENRQLSEALLDSEFRLLQLERIKVENERLRSLLDSTAKFDDRRLVAEILSVDLDPYRQRFVLNRGVNNDVYVGQAILDSNGIVGQVVEVGQWSAEAVLITDADHAIPVVVNRNGLRTIAVGTGDQNRLRLPYLTNSADIEIGDLLVSSGLGEVFPAGYPVARVVGIEMRPGQPFADVVAEPVSSLDRAQEVLLVFSDEDVLGDEPATGLQRNESDEEIPSETSAAPSEERQNLAEVG